MDSSAPLTPPVAAVLCGGGARGALEVGFLQALGDLDIRLDEVIGASVGALNGAAVAGGMSPPGLAELWSGIRREDIVARNWRGWLRPWACAGLYTLDPLRRLLRRALPVTRFERLAIPLTIVTADLCTGGPVYWSGTGDLIEPLIASMSLPGVFPPVDLVGRSLVDGSVADHLPIDRAIANGARTIVSILCTCCPPPLAPPRHALGVLKRSFLIALDCNSGVDLEQYRSRGAQVHVVQPRFAADVGLLEFRYTEKLIAAGYRQTLAAFTAEGPMLRSLNPYRGAGSYSSLLSRSTKPA